MVYKKLFLACSGISVLGSSITYICMIVFCAKLNSIMGITWLVISSQLGITFSGIANGFLSRKITNPTLLKNTELIRSLLILIIIIANIESLSLLCAIMFSLSILEGIYHPNRYRFINLSFQSLKEKNIFISKLQSIDSSLAIIGPIIGGIMITILPLRLCLIIDFLSFLISFMYWNYEYKSKHNLFDNKENYSIIEGYLVIKNNKSLITMNIARILGNCTFIVWTLLLPIILIKIYSEHELGLYQGIILGIMSLGLFSSNFFAPKNNKNSEAYLETYFLRIALTFGLCAILVLGYGINIANSIIVIGLSSFFYGISNAGYRTGGILIGTRITPQSRLHLVISAADSIIRPVSAIMTLIIGVIITYSNASVFIINMLLSLSIISIVLSIYFYFISRSQFSKLPTSSSQSIV